MARTDPRPSRRRDTEALHLRIPTDMLLLIDAYGADNPAAGRTRQQILLKLLKSALVDYASMRHHTRRSRAEAALSPADRVILDAYRAAARPGDEIERGGAVWTRAPLNSVATDLETLKRLVDAELIIDESAVVWPYLRDCMP